MSKISTYPVISSPALSDLLIGTDINDLKKTKNFRLSDVGDLIGQFYVPYIGATGNVDLGLHSMKASGFLVPDGLSSWFLKADGTVDTTAYQPAGDYITQLSGEATAIGPGNASVVLNNLAVISKVLTGLDVTGGTVLPTDSILAAFGKIQNQINSLVSGVGYQGVWNASTNTPFLESGVGTKGHYYVVSVPGDTDLDGITDWKLGDWAIFNGTAWNKVDNTDAVVSVNGKIGAVVLTTTDIEEGTNLYYLDTRVWHSLTLSTTGNSGAATYDNTTGLFNIPEYTLAGLGGVPLTREITINGTAYDLSDNRTWSVGTVTSIEFTGPLTGGTITDNGTVGITQAGVETDGYLSSLDWNTFNNKQDALTNPVTGVGTVNRITMWTGTSQIGDSGITADPGVYSFFFNEPSSATINFVNADELNPYTYSIVMDNGASTKATRHIYSLGNVESYINSVRVQTVFGDGNMLIGSGSVNNGYKLEIDGNLFVGTIDNSAVDTDAIIVSDGGLIKYITTAQLAAFLGGGGGVLQYDEEADFPLIGESNKLYIALDINQAFYWKSATSSYVKLGTFNNNIFVSLSGGKTLGRYTNGQTIPSAGKTPEEVVSMLAAEPINPTVSLSSPTVVQFNQSAISNVLNFSYTINTVGASVASAVLSYRRQGASTWNTLSTNTAITTFTHSFTDSVPFSGATNAAGNNVLAYQYQYVVTDTAGATTTVTINVTPQVYVAPSISFSAPATTLNYPAIETNTKREIGNTSSNVQGSTSRNSALVAISGYQFQVSVNGGAYTNIGSVVSLGASGGSFTPVVDAQSTANSTTAVTYRVLIYDAYNATTGSPAASTYAIIFRNIIFYGPVAAAVTDSAGVRALSSFIFTDGSNPFILNTGNTLTRFVAAMPAASPVIKTITQVIDLDALNANITSSYVLGQFNVQNGGGVNVLYNVYQMVIGSPYASNHRHQITTT